MELRKIILISLIFVGVGVFSQHHIFAEEVESDELDDKPKAVLNQNVSENSIVDKESDDDYEKGIKNEAPENNLNNSTNSAVTQKRLENTIRNAERLMEGVDNSEMGNQLQNSFQTQLETMNRIQTELQTLEKRGAAMKFLIGPDYKFAGIVRSDLVRLQNQTREMERLREQLTNTEQINAINDVIAQLNQETTNLQTQLEQNLSGFSLFGWLSKLLSGYK